MPISKYTKRELEEKNRKKIRDLEDRYTGKIKELSIQLNDYLKRIKKMDQKITDLVHEGENKEERIKSLVGALQESNRNYNTLLNEDKGKLKDENKLLKTENEILKKIIERYDKNYRFDKLNLIQKIKLILC